MVAIAVIGIDIGNISFLVGPVAHWQGDFDIRSTAVRAHRLPPQSSSASRFIAGAAGFFGTVRGAEALRNDALTAERARMLEDHRAVAGELPVKGDAIRDTAEKFCERRLAVLQPLNSA